MFTFCIHCNKCHSCSEEIKLASDMKAIGDQIRNIIYEYANQTINNIYHYHTK
jgi:hypothetical protein